jgi:hypothetical protein
LTISVTAVDRAIDSIKTIPGLLGAYKVMYTPTIKGVYHLNLKINNVFISTDTYNGVYVKPALEYSATSTHNISQVNVENVREWFTVQLRDRFGNTLDSGIADSSAFMVSMTGSSDICQSDNGIQSPIEIPVVVEDRSPYTDGMYSFHYDPTIAGSYQMAIKLRTRGGLLATYFKTDNLSDPVLASTGHLHDGKYVDPYWCDGIENGNFFTSWTFGPVTFCDKTIGSCGCDSTRLDKSLSFNWNDSTPLVYDERYTGRYPSQYFSVQWEGYLSSPATGTYTITVTSDYGAQLFLNGTKPDKTNVTNGISSVLIGF